MMGQQNLHPPSGRRRRRRPFARGAASLGLAAALAVCAPHPGVLAASAAGTTHSRSHLIDVSSACPGQNAEVEQAVDPSRQLAYETWMGCDGIGFARSTDGGLRFDAPVTIPGSLGADGKGWDPAIAVAPNGTVYVAFMIQQAGYIYPVVAASFDHGRSFPQASSLLPRARGNWGDRDFIAVAPDGTVYLTWDYGPNRKSVTYICSPVGSCAFATGDLNVVVQESTDGGKRWSPIVPVSPGFPASGGDSAPLVVEPNGRVDVLYQGYRITNPKTYTMAPAHSYFTSSTDGGSTWSAPVLVGSGSPDLTMSLAEWWIDGSIGIDAAGNLYATWDTQKHRNDVGWISFSTDHGKHWSPLQRVTPDHDNAAHIVEVVGGPAGIAYVGWLSNESRRGWAQHLRVFSISEGWLTPPIRISANQFGDPKVWPGDTFGISTLSASRVAVSWGSAIAVGGHPKSQIYAAVVTFQIS